MPIFDFKCSKCGHMEEHIISPSVIEKIPEFCPQCNTGLMEKQFSAQNQSFDVVGGYQYQHGKKALHKKTAEERSQYLTPGPDGKYKNPY